jgi:hypothetical protein
MFTAKDCQKCLRLYARSYAGRKFYDSLYREHILGFRRHGNPVLDAGCGGYLKLCNKGLWVNAHMVETTVETSNHNAPFGVRGDLSRLPFSSGAFDRVVPRSIVEHLPHPLRVFRGFSSLGVLCKRLSPVRLFSSLRSSTLCAFEKPGRTMGLSHASSSLGRAPEGVI